MKKPTKRKGFNFMRSYFDVLNEIDNDKDKLDYLLAIINKQFLDEDPTGLSFISNLCYESQRHHIEQAVKGYKDRMGTDLLGNPLKDPKQDPPQGGYGDPPQQEEEKEKGKGKGKVISIDWDSLISIYNSKFGRQIRVLPDKAKKQIRDRLKEGYSKSDFVIAMDNAKSDQYHIDNNYKYITLEFLSRPDKFERYTQNHNFKTPFKSV